MSSTSFKNNEARILIGKTKFYKFLKVTVKRESSCFINYTLNSNDHLTFMVNKCLQWQVM